MKAKITNMTEGSPSKLIITFALPLMVGNIFQQLYTVIDTMVVGRALGVSALAALGATDWLNWLFSGLVQGFAQGFSILMAQEFGSGNYKRLRKVIFNSLILSVICSLLILVISQACAHPILTLLHTPDDIMDNSLLYLRIIFLGMPVIMAYNLSASILRSLGDSKTPLHAMIAASITNIVLDLIFVLVFHWGIAGAAIATLLAQLLSSVYCFHFIRRIEILKTAREELVMEKAICEKLLLLSSPIAFQNTVIFIGGMIVQSVVNSFGVLFIAGFTATNKLYGILESAATSYGYSMSTYAGQNLGAGNIKRIRKGVRSAMLIALATSFTISVIMLLLGRYILTWFLSGDPAQIEAALEIAYHYLAIMSLFLSTLYLLYIIRSTLQGTGDTVMPFVSGIAEFVMRVGAALILPRFLGQDGIFYAEILAWIGADVILLGAYIYHVYQWNRLPSHGNQSPEWTDG
ncbi:MAG: MATE family efflux transporter [Lachnospiraceae bacterium]|nr:MATE family efflux transporter [Lachnospiraceae bacterium]MDE7008202.1 MATE family efflux transporter [Lachnospiraceae bacterium]